MLSIIGCGNPTRSDDGVGPQVIRLLRESGAAHGCADVSLFDAATDGMAVMFRARGCRELIIVDACRSGGEPGAVYRLDGAALAAEPEHGVNLHAFRWDHALYAGRRIFGDEFPASVTVYLVEAQDLGLGLELSAPVAATAQRLAADLAQRIAEHGSVIAAQ